VPSLNQGPGIDTLAKHVFLLEADTNTVLFDKAADEHMPTASMSKMMTAYVAFKMLKDGKAKLTDELPVSEAAWRTQGSKMFVPLGAKVSVEDLLRGMIIDSGNDACIVLAEGLAGSQQAYVDLMNKEAEEMGLKNTHFMNVDGMPDPDHYSSARDLATIALRTIHDFPDFYKIYSEKEFTFNNIKQGNRNPLLYKEVGADGLKTGHTEEAGYSLTASVVRDGRRIVMVFGGEPTMKARAQESERLIEWAFRTFQNYKLFTAGDKVDDADVWLGADPKVPVTVDQDVVVTLPRGARKDMKVSVSYDKQIPAPVKKGQEVGQVTITAPDAPAKIAKVYAAADDPRMGVFGRMTTVAGYWIWGGRH
jgi:D-alanyl-D-alanine carboxypeptidase (penicillin-binding protein 5/6)